MNGLALAEAHRIDQVELSKLVTALMGQAWTQTMTYGSTAEAFPTFLTAAEMLVGKGRTVSAGLARKYYERLAALLGFDTIELDGTELNRLAFGHSMLATGPDKIEDGLRRGLSLDEAKRLAMSAALGAGKRYVLDGGRDLLLEAADRDPQIERWARVSDGSPCSFCAMLVSRGAVYSADTVGFKAHDFCGCGVRLVYPGEDDGGVDAQAEKYLRLWKTTNNDPYRFAAGLRLARGETKRSYLLDEDEVDGISHLLAEGLTF